MCVLIAMKPLVPLPSLIRESSSQQASTGTVNLIKMEPFTAGRMAGSIHQQLAKETTLRIAESTLYYMDAVPGLNIWLSLATIT
jgi:hypothetical protein